MSARYKTLLNFLPSLIETRKTPYSVLEISIIMGIIKVSVYKKWSLVANSRVLPRNWENKLFWSQRVTVTGLNQASKSKRFNKAKKFRVTL